MDYIGKVCPYCKTEFQEGDDVVFCSLCEMPHHKECWIENKACTTFGCTGTIFGADQALIDKISEKTCHICGAVIKEGQNFCPSCGASVAQSNEPHYRVAQDFETEFVPQMQYAPQPVAQSMQPQYTPQPVEQPMQPQYAPQSIAQPIQPQYAQLQYQSANYNSIEIDKDLAVFLESNQYEYGKAFAEMDKNRSVVMWKHPAFWLGPLWFAYRKMFPLALAYVGISVLFSRIPVFGLFIEIALRVCGGLFGVFFYKKKVESELEIVKNIDNDIRKIEYLKDKGGTNVGLSFAIVGISIASVAFLNYIMGV